MAHQTAAELTLMSLNVEGFVRNDCYVKHILLNESPDFLCLQETWLMDGNLHVLDKVNDDYISVAKSGVDNVDRIYSGRPHGGVAILFRKRLCNSVNAVKFESRRVCGFTVNMLSRIYLLICVYLPVDLQSNHAIDVEYEQVLNEIEGILNASLYDDVVLCGDFNTDFGRNNIQSLTLNQFIERNDLMIGWNSMRAKRDATYVNTDLNHLSTIDHVVVNENLFNSMNDMRVASDVMNRSYHSLIIFSFKALSAQQCDDTSRGSLNERRGNWLKASKEQKDHYAHELSNLLYFMQPNDGLLSCINTQCVNSEHKDAIDKLCRGIAQCCVEADRRCIPPVRGRGSRPAGMPGWNDEVEGHRKAAHFWHSIWVQSNRPTIGHVYEIMKATRRTYHYAIRFCKKNELLLRKRQMAELNSSDQQEFWRRVKRVNSSPKVSPSKMDEATGNDAIAELFARKYRTLYQSVPTSANEMSELHDDIDSSVADDSTELVYISPNDVQKAVKRLKCGKSDDQRYLYSDHLIHGDETLCMFLSLLFNCMLCHGHTPPQLLSSTFVSIPKNSRGSLCDSNNYRSIALCSSISKLLDLIVIDKWRDRLVTSDLQFGFRRGHSTVMCTAMYKETVQRYVTRKSTVYSVLLDASKAFDKVQYGALFKLLIKRNLPPVVIRLLFDSYTRQNACVSWSNVCSPPFDVHNGVKQGGVLSPILFTVYVDTLLDMLQQSGIGCYVENHYAGAFCYADDVVLLCPSLRGLNQMLHICSEFARDYNVTFNAKKTVGIYFGRSNRVEGFAALNGVRIEWQEKVKHLGNVIATSLTDEDDCKAKKSIFIGSVNRLIANFKHLGSNLKARLFNSYCSCFYGAQMWKLRCSTVREIFTAWNKGVRALLRLPLTTHRWLLGPLAGCAYVEQQLTSRTLAFLYNAINSSNQTLCAIVTAANTDARSDLGANLAMFRYEYEIHVSPEMDINAARKKVMCKGELSQEQYSLAAACKEILSCLDGCEENGLAYDENQALLTSICCD